MTKHRSADQPPNAFAQNDMKEEISRLFTELLGTFALVFFDCGAKVVGSLTGKVTPAAQAIAPGLVVAAMIYTIGHRSGAHMNPAVTFAFALRRVFPVRRVAGYWTAQLFGAVIAAFVLRMLFGNVEHLGATLPQASLIVCFVLEVTLTFMLVSVILGTATQHRVIGPNAAAAVGSTVIACGIVGKSISGASMNPARSIGPALISGNLEDLWIYILGPLIGAIIAVGAAYLIHGTQREPEEDAARGSQKRNE